MISKLSIVLLCIITASLGIIIGSIIPSLHFDLNLFGDFFRKTDIFPTESTSLPCALNYGYKYTYENELTIKGTSEVARYRYDTSSTSVNAEALAALQMARVQSKKIMQSDAGRSPPSDFTRPPDDRHDKALRLYRHALALAPRHADILNEYGEYMERQHRDLIAAETLYCRAVVSSPSHTKAVANRQRTLPLVAELDRRERRRIDEKRAAIMAVSDAHAGLRRMKLESYFSHIYHTVAIEGNTFTLSQTRSLVETRMAIGGKSLVEHNEILGLEAALKYVNATLVHRIGELTVDDVLSIHKRVLGFVDPLGAGLIRTTQVFVGSHVPPAAAVVPRLLQEFIDWLNDRDTLRLHPIELAALSHYRLVALHPFYDGNGRTCRLLMNFILMQAGFPAVTIKKEQKQEYYECLEQANDGDIRPFIRFIARCTERTLDEYLWATEEESKLTERFREYDSEKTIQVDSRYKP